MINECVVLNILLCLVDNVVVYLFLVQLGHDVVIQ